MNFVGIRITESSPLAQTIEEGIILELTNFASLNPETPTQVWVETEGDSYLLVTLNKHTPQYTSTVVFSDQDLKIFVKGAGEVHITGSFQIDGMLDSDDEELDDDDLMAEYPSSSSGDEDGEHPAYAGTRRIEMLEESSSSEEPIPVQTKKQKVAPPAPQPAKPAQQPGQQGGSSKKKNKKKKGSKNQGKQQ